MTSPRQEAEQADPFSRPDARWLLLLAGTVSLHVASAALFARFAGDGFSWVAFVACLLPACWAVYLLSTYRSFVERMITWAALAGAVYWALPALAMLGFLQELLVSRVAQKRNLREHRRHVRANQDHKRRFAHTTVFHRPCALLDSLREGILHVFGKFLGLINLFRARNLLHQILQLVNALIVRRVFVTNYSVGTIAIQERRSSLLRDGESFDRLAGFRLTQTVEIRSPEVERIARLDRETVALVEQGVVFTTEAPKFIYSKAGEAKVEMLAEATKDARARADQIAVQGGRAVRQLSDARMGVFQITPVHSSLSSWDGMNDTSSLEKTITAVVTATFSLE